MKKKRNMARNILRAAAGIGIAVVFVLALIGSARLGTNAALAQLPESVRNGIDDGPPIGVEVVLGPDGEPVFLASKKSALRNFFFTYPTVEDRRTAETESTGLRRFVGEIRVRTVKRDADLMNVRVLAGALNGGTYWLHISQLPEVEPTEQNEGGKGEG
jgi:hypothetical protein